MRTKLIALFLVFSLLALSGNLMAKEKRGAELLITKKDGQQVKGELITVKQNSLLLLVSGVDYSVDIEDVSVIKIRRKSRLLLVSSFGLLSGMVFGYLIGHSLGSENGIFGAEDTGMMGMKIGAPIGLIVGVTIATEVRRYETIQVEGRPDTEVKEALEYLGKKARIPDYQ